MNPQEIKAKIEELQQQVKLLEEQERKEREAKLKAFTCVYRYKIVPLAGPWDSLAVALGGITINATMENLEEYKKLRGCNKDNVHSVYYVWHNGLIHRGGGGCIVLTDPAGKRDSFSNEPIPCTREEWESIKSGVIPEKFLVNQNWGTFIPA